jgi:hypothetical protein
MNGSYSTRTYTLEEAMEDLKEAARDMGVEEAWSLVRNHIDWQADRINYLYEYMDGEHS